MRTISRILSFLIGAACIGSLPVMAQESDPCDINWTACQSRTRVQSVPPGAAPAGRLTVEDFQIAGANGAALEDGKLYLLTMSWNLNVEMGRLRESTLLTQQNNYVTLGLSVGRDVVSDPTKVASASLGRIVYAYQVPTPNSAGSTLFVQRRFNQQFLVMGTQQLTVFNAVSVISTPSDASRLIFSGINLFKSFLPILGGPATLVATLGQVAALQKPFADFSQLFSSGFTTIKPEELRIGTTTIRTAFGAISIKLEPVANIDAAARKDTSLRIQISREIESMLASTSAESCDRVRRRLEDSFMFSPQDRAYLLGAYSRRVSGNKEAYLRCIPSREMRQAIARFWYNDGDRFSDLQILPADFDVEPPRATAISAVLTPIRTAVQHAAFSPAPQNSIALQALKLYFAEGDLRWRDNSLQFPQPGQAVERDGAPIDPTAFVSRLLPAGYEAIGCEATLADRPEAVLFAFRKEPVDGKAYHHSEILAVMLRFGWVNERPAGQGTGASPSIRVTGISTVEGTAVRDLLKAGAICAPRLKAVAP
jgi:hypothetical protein